jgi:hypothetical protein
VRCSSFRTVPVRFITPDGLTLGPRHKLAQLAAVTCPCVVCLHSQSISKSVAWQHAQHDAVNVVSGHANSMQRYRDLVDALNHPEEPTRVQSACCCGPSVAMPAAQHTPRTAVELLAFTAFTAAGELQKLQKHALELPQDLQEAVQFYVLGSSSQVPPQVTHSASTGHCSQHTALSRTSG